MTSSDSWRKKSDGRSQTYGTLLSRKHYEATDCNLCSTASISANISTSTEGVSKKRLIQEEVNSLLVNGDIEPVGDRNRRFYLNLFMVKKTDGSLRPVIDLRGLNCYIKKRTFRISTIKDVSQSIRRGDWASTINLKDAYLLVPIAKDHRRLLRFWWAGKSFQFRRLPLGLSSAKGLLHD